MKKTRKIFAVLIVIVFAVYLSLQSAGAYSLVNLQIGGSNVNYKGTSIPVKIPDVYEKQKEDMRAVWVSAYVSDISMSSQSVFISEFETLLDNMNHYNLNTMVFHVRTHNDAFYPSELNPKSWRASGINFNIFDPVEYAVRRCHEEGFEFHAWLNPYRVGTVAASASYNYAYPAANPASDPANVLSTGDVNINLLDPSKPVVQNFLVNTCMELIENYDIDAIHFDDYFYASGAVTSRTTAQKRADVDTFIENLSTTMKAYNLANNRFVQLGIAPTGVYRTVASRATAIGGTYDSNGTYSVYGSNNAGCQEHYGEYLCADTKKWVDEEWIDYITPQSYWPFTHTIGQFADLMEWWQMVVANKNVNLYSGMGIARTEYSWGLNVYEAEMQTRYLTQFEHARGTMIYKYLYIKQARAGDTGWTSQKIAKLAEIWDYKSLIPEIRSMTAVNLSQVSNAFVTNDELSWSLLTGAKRYAIYRSTTGDINSSIEQLIDVVGNSTTSYKDKTAVSGINYTYGIRAISGTNTEGALTVVNNYISVTSVAISGAKSLYIDATTQLSAEVLPLSSSQNVIWSSSSKSIATVNSSGLVTGVDVGKATITAKSVVNASIYGTYEIDVLRPSPNSITISGEDTIYLGSSVAYNARVLPSGAAQTVVWTCNNPGIATVNSSTGVVTANASTTGTVTITATSTENSVLQTKQINIVEIAVSSITITGANNVEIGKTIQLNANILPNNAINKNVTWTSSNSLIASVAQTGLVSAVGVGVVFIKATSNSNPSIFYEYQVTVNGLSEADYYNILISVNNNAYGDISLANYDTEYYKNNSITVNAKVGYKFLFLTENNKIISFQTNYQFRVTNDVSYKAYFAPDDMYYVLFMDQSRRMLSIDFCNSGESATAPVSDLIPVNVGYTFNNWDQNFNNISDNMVVMPTYVKDITTEYAITITNGTVSSSTAFYDETITVNAVNQESFSYWTRNEKIVSYDYSYTFSVYGNETVIAVLNGSIIKNPLAIISPFAIDYSIDAGLLTFVGAFSLPDTMVLIETGMLAYEGNIASALTVNTSGVNKVKVSATSANNEFAVTLTGVTAAKIWNVCTYVSYLENDMIKYVYSNVLAYQKELLGEELLLNIVSSVPSHIYDNYTFPVYEGLTWSYETGQDSSLFNLAAGTYTSVHSLDVAMRTINATLNGHTISKQINFGILAVEDDGKFYHSVSTHVPTDTWSGWTLTKSNQSLFMLNKVIEVVGDGTIPINNIMSEPENIEWVSAGSYICNKGASAVSFVLSQATNNLESYPVRLGVVVSASGLIRQIESNISTTITLAPGEALWTAKYLDVNSLNFGNAYDFALDTPLTLTHVRNLDGVSVPTISIIPITATINQNETVTIVASVQNSFNTDVTFTSSDVAVATVNHTTGVVTGVSEGVVSITVTSVADSNIRAIATINVNPAPTINVSPTTATLAIGVNSQLTATINYLSNTAVTWSSSDVSVATVSAGGLVTTVAFGSVIITATAVMNSNLKANSSITVSSVTVPTISITPSTATVNQNELITVYATVQNATNTNVVYSSSNEAVATVNATTGVVRGLTEGSVIITATAEADSNVKATAAITVNPALTVTIMPENVSLRVGEPYQLTAVVNYSSNLNVTWNSSDPAKVSVDNNGIVTGLSVGSVTITATSAADSNVKTTAIINVIPDPTITITPASISLKKGLASQLTAVVSYLSNYTVTWTSSDPDKVSVDNNGLVTAIKGQKGITITATAVSGTVIITATAEVTVTNY